MIKLSSDHYRCSRCKYTLPKEKAKISGYDSEHSLRHVHCPNCGKVITWSPDSGGIQDVMTGAGYLVAGGLLSYLLFFVMNVYALQLGGFVSLYGLIKVLFALG